MAGEVASAYVSLLPSAKGFGKSTQRQIGPQMNSVAKSTGSRFGKVFASSTMSPLRAIGAAAIGLFAVAKVKDFFQSAIAEARESQKVSAITAQVIKSTGGAANISAGQVGRLATSISNMTGIDDEAIQSGANLLLTFKNIKNEAGAGNDIFDQTTRIMTDMSVAMGTDAKSSAIQLGKALNDPVKGISALSRVGVTFTDQQKAQIETLVKSGRTLDAQKIILRELNSEFGGTAAAAATAGEKFKTTFANFQESIGTALLPLLDRLLIKGIQVINFLQSDVPRAMAAFRGALDPVIAAVRGFVEDNLSAFKLALSALGGSALTSLITLIGGSLVSAIGVLAGALLSPIALVGALAGAAVYAYVHFEGFRTAVNNLATSARSNLLPALQVAAQYVVTTVVPALQRAAQYVLANVVPALIQMGNVLRTDVLPIVRGFASFMLTQFYPTMIKAWAVVAQKLVPVFVALWQTYTAKILPVQRQVLAQIRQYGPVIGPTATAITKMIAALAALGATIAGKTLPPSIKFASALSGPVFSGLLAVMKASNQAEAAIGQFARAVVLGIAKAVGAIQALPGKAKAALGNVGSILYSAGQEIIQGLINGVQSKIGELTSKLHEITSLIPIHKGPPAKDAVLLRPAGQLIMKGLTDGINDGISPLQKKLEEITAKIRAGLEKTRDSLKSTLDGIKSDFSSLRDSVSSAFAGDLFSATSASSFISGAFNQSGLLDRLTGALKKLRKWGLDPQFLSQLFASGNSALILDLASGGRGQAHQAADIYGLTQDQSRFLGGTVAMNQFGADMKGVRQELREVNKHLASLPKNIGKELDHAGAKAKRGSK